MRIDYCFKCETPKPIIFDCGANLGHSTEIFRSSHPEASIYAYEPEPTLYKGLTERFKNHKQIHLFNAAVWDSDGKISFFPGRQDSGSCMLSTKKTEEPTAIHVPSVRLRNQLAEHDRIDFLKIDIEGAETIVVLDCKELLNRVDRIFIEYHSFISGQQELSKILALLEELEFKYQIDEEWNRRENRWQYEDNGNNMDCQVKVFALHKRLCNRI